MKHLIAFLTAVLTVFSIAGLAACTKSAESQIEKVEVSIFSRPLPERNGLNEQGKKVDWLDVSSFCCYYGAFTPEMTDYDVAICESRNLGAEGIKKLNDAGVYTICYITVGEDDSLNTGDGLGEGGYASYYIYENGVPKTNTNWNSYFVDAGSPVWQEIIIEKARQILAMGADGLFMDTIDSVDVDMSTAGGMVSLVKRLREEFPDAKLVANRGFSVLDYIGKYIDGMMFESFNTTWDFEKNYATDLSESANEYNIATAVNTINRNRTYNYFPVFALDYVNDYEIDYMAQDFIDRSWVYDFIPYLTTAIYLDKVTVTGLTPQSQRGSIALKGEGDIAQSSGQPNGNIGKENLAYVKNGATVTVDSYYSSDYRNNGTTAINDGFISETMYWAKRAWASGEEKVSGDEEYVQEHYIEFQFTQAEQISKVVIAWAYDNGIYYSSSTVVIEILENGEWKEVVVKNDIAANSDTTVIEFASVSAQKIRVRQPAGGGASFRKGIMWVSEVEIYA